MDHMGLQPGILDSSKTVPPAWWDLIWHLLRYHGQHQWHSTTPGNAPRHQKDIQELLKDSEKEVKASEMMTKPIKPASKSASQKARIGGRRQGAKPL